MSQQELNQDEVYSRFMSSSGLFRHDLREYDTDFENVLNFTMNDSSPAFKNVLSINGEKQLTHTIYTHDTLLFPNDNCPITCTVFKEGDPIIQLPCKHAYEPESIVRWLKEEKAECPTCRYKLESTEVRIADTSQADTSQADTSQADTSQADTSQADTSQAVPVPDAVDNYYYPPQTLSFSLGALHYNAFRPPGSTRTEQVASHTEPVASHAEPVTERTALEIVTDHIQSIPTELIHFVYNFHERTSFADESIPGNSNFGRHFR